MPRQERTQISYRPTVDARQGGRQVRSQVAPGATDSVGPRSYYHHQSDPTLQGFLAGLGQVQPSISRMMQEQAQAASEQAKVDRLGGAGPQSEEAAYTSSYFHTDGLVRGQNDASSLIQSYTTEFDKDAGDLEGWLSEKYSGTLKGITDQDYIRGYNKALAPALADIRKAHTDHHRKAVEGRVESNAMQLLSGGLRAYLVNGKQAVPPEYITGIRDYMGKNLGVSSQRFDELLFESARSLGEQGYMDAFELLKQDHPDGSPGLYHSPAWRSKIEAAEAHATNVAHTRAQRDRDQRQNEMLLPVFMEEDPKRAQELFTDLRKSGLFTRADDLIKWEKLVTEKVDGKPSLAQLTNEGELLTKAYQGGITYRDILSAEARGDITSSQRKYLLSERRRVDTENRTIDAQRTKDEAAIYKTREFKDAEEFLKRILKPRPKDASDIFGNGSEFDNANLAQAHRELGRAVAGRKPEEIGAVVDEITSRYKKRQEGYTKDQQDRVGKGDIPFKTLAEAVEAAKKGLLSPDEYRIYIDYFKGNNVR